MKKFLLMLAVFALVACGGAAPTVPPGAGVDDVIIEDALQRIVALGEDGLLADLLALGIKPVGASVNVVEAVKGVAPEDLDGIQLFPTQETNLESLTALNPDLIIIYASYLEYIKFDMLTQIATTVVIDSSDEFQAYVDVAKLFDKQAEAQAGWTPLKPGFNSSANSLGQIAL
jgi:ABC-type Fe3+-hydroxamate transport system substrate-binding protein